MKIVHMTGKQGVKIVEAPDPVPGVGEVIIQTAMTGICGSEMHAYREEGVPNGNGGHEGVGTVVRLGDCVTTLKVGQRVGVSAITGCGACPYCAKGQYTWCASSGFCGNMHAEQFVAPANACHRLPDDVPWDAGVLLTGDGLGVPYHTSRKIASPEIKTVAVFGAGPIGLGNVLMQAHLGRRVIAVDISPTHLEHAKNLGAAEVVNAKDNNPVEIVKALTGGKGADVCFECVGQQETALACFEAVRIAGTVVFNGEQGPIPLSPSGHFIRRDITAVGSWFYHISEYGAMLELYRNGLAVTKLISHRIPFKKAASAYKQFASGESAKVLLVYS
jgi:propanol-preferring alcohol dehydrogenase